MTTKDLREIQEIGTSHDVIGAIITYLESKEKPVKAPKEEKVVVKKSKK